MCSNIEHVTDQLNMKTYRLDGIPFDGKPTTKVETIFTVLAALIYIFAAVGVALAIVCLIFNFIFRSKK